MYDEKGQVVTLYGVSIVSGQGEGITLSDIQKIKSLGFNTIRLNNLYWRLIQPYNETLQGIDESYFTTGAKSPYHVGLDQIVQWAVDQKMYIILSLIWTQYYPPPKWAFQNLPPISPTSSDIQLTQAYTSLIGGNATRERIGISNTWKYIANRYQNIPNVIFEILNEPIVLQRSLAGTPYKTFNENIISTIESAETRSHLKIIQMLIVDENYTWKVITDTAMDVSKSNVAWASHHYAPMNDWDPNGKYWHDSFIWHGESIQSGWGNGTTYAAWAVATAAQKVHSWNRPWIVTEFSKVITQKDWQQWYNVVTATMIENHVAAWVFFCYDHDTTKEVGWNLNDESTQGQIMPILRLMINS